MAKSLVERLNDVADTLDQSFSGPSIPIREAIEELKRLGYTYVDPDSDEVTAAYLNSINGKVIRFLPAIMDYDMYMETDMKARIIGSVFNGSVHTLKLNFEEFEEENHKLQTPNYWDDEGNATLTAVEAGWYKLINTMFIDDKISTLPFVFVEEE